MTNPLPRALALLACATLLACGSSTPDPVQPPAPNLQAYDCGSGVGSPPPAKLILHPVNGVSGRYLVVLRASVQDLAATATELARAHNGSVFAVWGSIHAIGMNVADGQSEALSGEPNVCYVEQDAVASGA